jgi:hypothetical protein
MNENPLLVRWPWQGVSRVTALGFAGLLVSLAAVAAGSSYEQRVKEHGAWEQQDFTERNESVIDYPGSSSIRQSERTYSKAEERVATDAKNRRVTAEAAPRQTTEAEARRTGGADERRTGEASYRGSIRHDSH